VLDPLGGINSLWPLFGIANQLLAAVALVVATTILLKMGKRKYLWVTLGPATALVTVTMTASYEKIFSSDPHLGFLAAANQMAARVASGSVAADKIAETARLIFNQRLDAAVTAALALIVLVLVVEALFEWIRIWTSAKPAMLHEAPYLKTRWLEGD
jgi:carbon starvation protein